MYAISFWPLENLPETFEKWGFSKIDFDPPPPINYLDAPGGPTVPRYAIGWEGLGMLEVSKIFDEIFVENGKFHYNYKKRTNLVFMLFGHNFLENKRLFWKFLIDFFLISLLEFNVNFYKNQSLDRFNSIFYCFSHESQIHEDFNMDHGNSDAFWLEIWAIVHLRLTWGPNVFTMHTVRGRHTIGSDKGSDIEM